MLKWWFFNIIKHSWRILTLHGVKMAKDYRKSVIWNSQKMEVLFWQNDSAVSWFLKCTFPSHQSAVQNFSDCTSEMLKVHSFFEDISVLQNALIISDLQNLQNRGFWGAKKHLKRMCQQNRQKCLQKVADIVNSVTVCQNRRCRSIRPLLRVLHDI